MEPRWLTWLREAQAIAQAGLAYPGDRFDKERFARLRELCAEAMAAATDLPLGTARELFCSETGFQTPKVDTRAFVAHEGKVLLVRETSGLWTLPGGWCEAHLSPAENTAKEALEEAGARVGRTSAPAGANLCAPQCPADGLWRGQTFLPLRLGRRGLRPQQRDHRGRLVRTRRVAAALPPAQHRGASRRVLPIGRGPNVTHTLRLSSPGGMESDG